MRTTQKYTFEEVCQHFKSQGCELLETTYVNTHHPMRYKCKCGGVGLKKFYTFKNHPNCDSCGKTSKLNAGSVAALFKENGCELLDQYETNSQSLRFKCKCGREASRTLKNFRKHPRCATCSGKHRYTHEEAMALFEKAGCKLLERSFQSVVIKMKYLCVCGKESQISLDKFMQGKRCKECGLRKGEKNGNWNPDRELVRLNEIISSRSHTHLKHLLKLQGKRKDQHTKTYLGYTVAELRDRITNHPNWSSLISKKWHIDHIFPVRAFLEHGITDLKLINALDNLQPLTAKRNLQKGGRYNKKKFFAWLQSKQT